MIIYNSMILWIALIGVLYLMARNSPRGASKKQMNDKVPMFTAIIVFSYIIFWIGVRSGVADTATYIAMFKACPKRLSYISEILASDSKARGFDIFQLVFKCIISKDYHAWLMTIAVLSGVPIMLVLRKRSCNFFYSCFLFMVMQHFTWMLNGIRQFLVVAILFLLSDWILEKKTIPFILAVLLLSTVHFTALIMIPMYFIVTEKPFGKKVILFCIVLLICIVFIEPFVATLEESLSETAYAGYTKQFAQDDGVNPLRVLVMLVPPAIAFVGRKRIRNLNDSYINICINMSVVSAGLYLLGVFTSGILIGRLPIYFELYNLILLPYLIEKCFTPKSTKILYILAAMGYGAFYFLLMRGSYYISDITGLLS